MAARFQRASLWIIEFQNAETHRQFFSKSIFGAHAWVKWIWVNTLFFHSCQRAKITRAPCRRRIGGAVPCAEKFGDLITADNREFSLKIVNLEAIIDFQSWYRTWLPNGSSRIRAKQTLPGNTEELAKFFEPNWKPKVIHTENSLEFGKACEDLSWNHCTSTPHRSETYGIAERAVRRVKEGTSAVLLRSSPNESWWAD